MDENQKHANLQGPFYIFKPIYKYFLCVENWENRYAHC